MLQNGAKLGTYTIVRPLGRGGMGQVYLAHDASLDRHAAIKTILGSFANDQTTLLRFRQEARAAAKLSHPNIVQVYQVDIESEPPYIAMEYVDGVTLESIVMEKGPVSWQRALTVCGQVASALQCAHEQRIIHRDIKLANVMIDRKGRARVADFGLAKSLDASMKMTLDHQTLGSPCYMSPEHWGQGELCPASDLFSLGIAMYEMITGDVPFENDSLQQLIGRILTQPLPSIREKVPGVPEVVEQFIETLAHRDLALRYQSASDVLEDLSALRNGQSLPHLSQRVNVAGVPGGVSAVPAEPESNISLVDDLLGDSASSASPSSFRAYTGYTPDTPSRRGPIVVAGGIVAVLVAGGILFSGVLTNAGPRDDGPPPQEAGQPPGDPPGPPPPRDGDGLFPGTNEPGGPPPQGPRGAGGQIRPPRMGEDFRVRPDGTVEDVATKAALESIVNREGHTVPAMRNGRGNLVPIGKNPQGEWVFLPPPPPRQQR